MLKSHYIKLKSDIVKFLIDLVIYVIIVIIIANFTCKIHQNYILKQ